MKKLIGTVAVAALLASAAFAELSISGGALQLWSPVKYNGGDVVTASECPWGGGRSASIGFTWVSEDEKAGSNFAFIYNQFQNDDDSTRAAPDGNRLIWVKPWDFLKLTIGHWDGINDIRHANTASEDWIRPGTDLGNLYAENEHTGAMIELFPVDGLTVRLALPFGDYGDYATNIGYLSYGMFEALHAEVEYTITDLLGIKLAWLGGKDRHNTLSPGLKGLPYKYDSSNFYNVGEIDVLLQLLAVENLQLDVGARINLLNAGKLKDEESVWDWSDDESNYVGGLASSLIGLKAGYAINDKFTVKADFAVRTYKKVGDYKQKPDFAFGVGVGVGLTDSLSLDADFRAKLNGEATNNGEKISDKETDPTFSFLVGLNYVCSTNASIGIGFQGKTNGGAIGGNIKDNGDNFGFAVPVRVNVSF